MRLSSSVPLKDILKITGGKIFGDENTMITGINEIHKVRKGDIVFVDIPKYYKKALESAATCILINEEVPCPKDKVLLVCDNPFKVYNNLVERYHDVPSSNKSICDDSQIHYSTKIDSDVTIGPGVVIGKNCQIHSRVVIYYNTIIGDNVIIKAGSVIGGDAFYYKRTKECYNKWNSCGRVIIRDDVHIGSNTTIDKGVSGDTIIGEGVKN